VKRLFVYFLLSALSSIFAMTATDYNLDILRTSGYSTLAESTNYSKFSYLSDTSTAAIDQTSSLTKYSSFGLMDISVFNVGAPYIVTMTVSSPSLSMGTSVTIDITVSEELRNWSIQIDHILQLNTTYNSGHILVLFQPLEAGQNTYILNADLVDIGGNIGNSVISFNLNVVDGLDKFIPTLITENRVGEIHSNRKNASILMFDLKSANTDNIWDGVTLNIDQKDGISLFDKVYLVETLTGRVIVSSSVMPSNTNIFLGINERTTISIENTRFQFLFDVRSSLPDGTTFNLKIVDFLSHQVIGTHLPMQTTVSIMSGMIKIVPQNQPIIMKAIIDAFTSALDQVTTDIQAEIPLGSVSQIRFHIIDLTSGGQSPTQAQSFTAVLITNDRYYMANSPIGMLQLTQNHQYVLVFDLIGSATSSLVSTNIFTVDITPPLKPNSLIVQTYTLNSYPGSMATKSNFSGIHFIVDIHQNLDPESGLHKYKIMQKSSVTPAWYDIVSSDVLLGNMVQVDYAEDNNAIYYFALMVQNGSGLWSETSDVKEVDLRTNGALIDTLFNNPNPFDSLHQRVTTIYYSLRNNADVDMYLYDMYGYFIRKWHFPSGALGGQLTNAIDWDGTNQLGDKVSMGGYILILNAKDTRGETMQKKYSIGVMR